MYYNNAIVICQEGNSIFSQKFYDLRGWNESTDLFSATHPDLRNKGIPADMEKTRKWEASPEDTRVSLLFRFADGIISIEIFPDILERSGIMKKIGYLIFLSLMLPIMLLLVSCSNDPNTPAAVTPSVRNYISTEVIYSEPVAQYGFRLDMDFTATEFAKYYFEAGIEDEEREACIEVTDKLLSNQSPQGVQPEIYIFTRDRYDYKYIDSHKLYASAQDWKSVEYMTDVLLVTYGESVHYGTAFGYANYLANSYNWNSYDGQFSNPSVSDICDLNYLCFDEDFITSNDVDIAKGNACAFVESYISQHGEQTFQQILVSLSKSLDALAAYYEENGVSYTPSTVQYGYGGKSYDYLVYSDYGTFYITKDWVDMNAEYNPLITDNFLHANYADTKAFFETNLNQMKQYQDLFNLDDYNQDLDIVFTKPISASKTSFYQSVDHRIYLYNVDSLMHEYIHALTMPAASMASWQVEGFARYFSYYYDLYGMAVLNQDYNNIPDTPELQYIHEYSATINRPIDMAKDYPELENIAVYSRSWKNPNENYITGSSFVQYLVKQYGEENVINSIYGNGNPLPQTYVELVKEWNECIESEYAGYSKYDP